MNRISFPTTLSIDLAEETGIHLGDGSMNYYNGKGLYQLRGNMNKDIAHYNTTITRLYRKLYNIDVKLRKMPSDSVYGFQIWSNDLVKFKHEVLGIPLGPKNNFKIPDFVYSSKEHSIAFLRGVFDTDGTLYLEWKNDKWYPRIEFTTISQMFAYDLKKLLTNMKYRATIHTFKPHNRKLTYRISIRGVYQASKWLADIGTNNPKYMNNIRKLK